MTNDPDERFPSGRSTRRGLFSAFGRWREELLPTDATDGDPADPFAEEERGWIETTAPPRET